MKALSFIKQCLAETIVEEPTSFASGRSSPPRHSTENPQFEKSYDLGWTWGRFSRENLDGPLQTALHAGPSQEQVAYSSGYADGYDGIYKNIYKQNARENPHAQHESQHIDEGDEADAVHDMHSDDEAAHYEKHYGKSPKKKAPATPKKSNKAVIKVKGKELKLENFIKQCLSEVITEPAPRKKKVYGNPKKLQATQFIKECLLEVLKDNLTEGGFDPQSQAGPNVTIDVTGQSPYAEWNSKMAKMEENDSPTQWYNYKILGIAPEVPEGLEFRSKIPDLESHPELWQAESPYSISKRSLPQVQVIKVEETQDTSTHGREAQQADAGQFDPNTFGVQNGIDDVTESVQSQSSQIQWQCPHCKKNTQIMVEIESPSDYIACADCEHCGKEINSPTLDQRVYESVISHFAGNRIIK